MPSATFNNNSSIGLYLEADNGPILANIYGGSFSNNGDYGLYVASPVYTAAANIYGGSFGSNGSFGILAQQKGIVNIYGGTFANNVAADLFNFSNTAVITLYGSDFTQNSAALPYGALSGDVTTPRSLTGRLQNNSTVQTFTYRGNIILAPGAAPAVPEPSPFALLGLGLLPLGVLVRRRVRK